MATDTGEITTGRQEPPRLRGRTSDLAAITAARSAVLVLAGNPGIGKSELLLHATRLSPHLAPPPLALARRPGALQAGLLKSLAEALVLQAQNDGGIERIAELVKRTARNFGREQLKGASKAVATFLVAVARDKLGDTAVDLASDLIDATQHTIDEQLIRRVNDAIDPDIIDVFIELAAEAHVLADQTTILTLDNAEQLNDDDYGILLDLPRRLPPGIHLHVAHSTPSIGAEKRIDQLAIAGAEIYRIGPLDDDIVRVWLQEEGISDHLIGGVLRTAGGYPLFISAALQHVRSGRPLSEMTGESAFNAQMRTIFRELEHAEQKACMHLAPFTDPPPLEHIIGALGVTEDDWAIMEARLVEQRILPSQVNGRSWFHELGRRAFWNDAMSKSQRKIAAQAAAGRILLDITQRRSNTIQEAIDFARLAPIADDFSHEHQGLDTCLAIDRDQLAAYAALAELTNEANAALGAQVVISHARAAFQIKHNLESALRSLKDCGLVGIAEDQRNVFVAGVWPSIAAHVALQGRVANEFGRALLPEIATSVFEQVISPAMGSFHKAACAVGTPGLARMSTALRELDYERDDATITINHYSGLIARAKLGEVPLNYQVNFASEEQRDSAFLNLRDLTEPNFGGARFEVSDVYPWPHPEPISDLRFTHAAILCKGGSHNAFPRNISHERLGPAYPNLRSRLQARLKIRGILKIHATQMESAILSLDREVGYVFSEYDGWQIVAPVPGLADIIEVPPLADPFGAFTGIELATLAGLEPHQAIDTITYSSAIMPEDPLIEVLEDAHKELNTFNRAQRHPHLVVQLNAGPLEERILHAMNVRTEIARDLIDAGLIDSPDLSKLYATLYVLIAPGADTPGLVAGANGRVKTMSVPHEAENSVHLEIDEAAIINTLWDDDLRSRFGAPSTPANVSMGDLIHFLDGFFGVDSGVRIARDHT